MGACCSVSKGTELNSSQTFHGENVPLSTHHEAVSAQPTGLLVDTNLNTTAPDRYHPPPANNTQSVGDVNSGSNLETKVKDIECDEKGSANIELGALEDEKSEDLKASIEPMVPPLQEEEDVCPTCLEEYDVENPKIITKCKHHFHLACILEWMERSDTCPVCDQEMIFSLAEGG
ncbi:RING/U-box superfamily protein [Striga hermonthica]|uniref:RING-type E3 ubiquitin transferase n=1 Tax=Striga hermonthica TaxID=68872 RepID=A0A9N7RBL0_STRHE|nr:RING/U-box superfamily protein [Striga hermonthica]